MKKISVITVTYNSEKTLKDTIESVLNQTYTDYEYIIVDGNSKDNTVKIIKEYEPKFKGKLKWVSEADEGIYDAFNKGIRMSTGEIIGIINSDDWYETNTIEEVARISLENVKNNFSMITGKICKYNENKKLYYLEKDKNVKSKVLKEMPVNHTSTFIYREVYDKVGLYNLKYKIAADYDFIYRAINAGVSIYFSDENLSNMRLGGISSNLKTAHLISKDRLKLRIENSGKKLIPYFFYFKEILILNLRKVKRIFIKSKYES